MRQKYIHAFVNLGEELEAFLKGDLSGVMAKSLSDNMLPAYHENGWFTEESIRLALIGIESWLKKEKLENWLNNYEEKGGLKQVGLIMAGNIPLVGFHDLLCVLVSGHKALIKMSSSDKILLPIILNRLCAIEPLFQNRIEYVERLKNYDAVIATGSNNSARYFEYYFREKPHIIRKNRNSLAILDGNEKESDMKELGKDVFNYFGLGCRNVSKLLLPKDYELNKFFAAIQDYSHVVLNKKYGNNYDYYKAFYMLNKADLLENGFIMMKEDESIFSPVSMLFYQYYSSENEVNNYLEKESENIQCVISNLPFIEGAIPFGKSQQPTLNDYADGVDTMAFLNKLN